MPNIRIRDKWEPLVKQVMADLGPRAGPAPILRELKSRVAALRARGHLVSTDYPSPRTIQRIKDDFPPEERREYQRFSWPESMELGALPWEASCAALSLLRLYQRSAQIIGIRPTIRLTRWFWRVTQAAPELLDENRLGIAQDLTTREEGGWQRNQDMDWWLAYHQNANPDNDAEYDDLLAESSVTPYVAPSSFVSKDYTQVNFPGVSVLWDSEGEGTIVKLDIGVSKPEEAKNGDAQE